jgi:ABC-type Fe3+-siderophore transport system permease subunit
MNTGTNTTFSLEYVISIMIILIVCTLLYKKTPNINIAIILVTGILVGYVSLYLLNKLLPKINIFSFNVYQYITLEVMNNFNSTGYMHIWPPILAVLIIFIALLYNRQLG